MPRQKRDKSDNSDNKLNEAKQNKLKQNTCEFVVTKKRNNICRNFFAKHQFRSSLAIYETNRKENRRTHQNKNAFLCRAQRNGQLVTFILMQFTVYTKSLFKMGFSKVFEPMFCVNTDRMTTSTWKDKTNTQSAFILSVRQSAVDSM